MAFIEWTPEYSVGIKLIDDQHKKLFAAINAYHDEREDSELMLSKLFAYIDFHFRTEEDFFAQFHYEGAARHIEEHHFYESRIKELEQEFIANQDGNAVRERLEAFIRGWIEHHILVADKKYTQCFLEHGLK